jgi:prepilin-type N-terminal cleavage/methylation domain-containing protein
MDKEFVIEGQKGNPMKNGKSQKGFSMLELLVAVAILLIVAGTVIMGMMRVTWSQSTIMNRTQVHASVRNATELMQQEIGQAGRVTASAGLTLPNPIAAGASGAVTINSTSGTATDGLYVGEQLVVDPSKTDEETVTITAVAPGSPGTVTATFANAHVANTPALVLGGFASGIVPPSTSSKLVYSGTGTSNTTLSTDKSSDGYNLKLYGDLNGDGNMYYVVYKCTPNDAGTGTLYRYVSNDLSTAATVGTGILLLDNLLKNPPTNSPAPCFTYTTKDVPVTINGGQVTQTFVLNVAVTLTVQTQNKDVQTGQWQKETKALLNIAPRNVFDAWLLASSPSGYTRAQPMPAVVLNTLSSATLTP